MTRGPLDSESQCRAHNCNCQGDACRGLQQSVNELGLTLYNSRSSPCRKRLTHVPFSLLATVAPPDSSRQLRYSWRGGRSWVCEGFLRRRTLVRSICMFLFRSVGLSTEVVPLRSRQDAYYLS